MVKRLFSSVSMNTISKLATVLVSIWLVFPVFVMLLNAINFDAKVMYEIWISLVYVIGCFGCLFGLFYLYNLISDTTVSKKDKQLLLLPYALFLVFGVWCVICSSKAKFVFVAILGYGIAQDSLSCYLAYAGFILLGTIVAMYRKNAIVVANVTIIVANLLAIISLMDNKITDALCVYEFTNCFHYQSVFFNTNHYAYYLALVTILSALLFVYTNTNVKKALYIVSFVIQSLILILNNTMGAYLAVLLTLVIFLITCIARKNNIKNTLIVFAVFAIVSLASNFIVDNVFVNFTNMFLNIKTLLTGSSTTQEVNSVGSGRGVLWKYALTIIKQDPIFGVGVNNVYVAVHNAYLQIAMYTGIVGLILYILPFASRTITMIKSAGNLDAVQKISLFMAMSYIISAFFGLTVFYTAPFFYVVVGVAFGTSCGKIVSD